MLGVVPVVVFMYHVFVSIRSFSFASMLKHHFDKKGACLYD